MSLLMDRTWKIRTQDIGTGHTLAGNYSLEAYGSSTENPEEIWILLEKE